MSGAVQAQAVPDPPKIEDLRYDEDYSYLRDPSARSGLWWEPFKHYPLDPSGSAYLSTGAEVRYRFEGIRNPDFNVERTLPRNAYLLQRVLLHGDLHLGPNLRVFAQFGSYAVFGERQRLEATQDNPADLAQAFADVNVPLGTGAGDVTLRGGRQEMEFGSSRLVSLRENPNVRRSFDGGRAFWDGSEGGVLEGWRIDAFLTRPVENRFRAFDDRSDPAQAFWGAYASGPLAMGLLPGLKLDAYYLGLQRKEAEFEQGQAFERRHTVGGRLSGEASGFDWDLEAAYQFGSFGTGVGLSAWTVATDVGYTFSNVPWEPRLGLKANVASGDRDPNDRTLGTFNPLFPKLPYFSEAALITPANVMDLAPSLTIKPSDDLSVTASWDVLWKHSVSDAFYAPPLSPVEGTAGRERFIGHSVQVLAEWQATREIEVRAAYVHFFAGEALEQAGARDVDFVMLSAALKF